MKEKKSNSNKMARRCFLTNCAKFAAGASFLSYSVNSFGNPNDSYEEYSYCIFKCPSPCAYDSKCVGCRNDSTGARATCTVRNCAIAKQLPSCAHCEELATCNHTLWINYPGQRTFALNKQKQWNLITSTTDSRTSQEEFKVYPNSTTDGFTLYNANQLKVDYRLFTTSGQIVITGKTNSLEHYIDISNLTSGSYLLSITKNDELQYHNKIIKR